MNINLGCGERTTPGWTNVDRVKLPGVDVVHDLDRYPYPFDTSSADGVVMSHVLEHLTDVVRVMEEIHRILRPGGTLELLVPHYQHANAYADPTHKHFFTEDSMRYFTGESGYDFYTHVRFRVLERGVRLTNPATRFPKWHLRKWLRVRFKGRPYEIRWVLQAVK